MNKKFLIFIPIIALIILLIIVGATITINLISPANVYNSSNANVNFVCNASGTNLTNISLYGNWTGSWGVNYTNKIIVLSYQESANASNGTGSVNSSYPLTNAYDENWSTWAQPLDGNTITIYTNFTKPLNALGGIRTVRTGNAQFYPYSDFNETINTVGGVKDDGSIPVGCWNQQPMQFEATAHIDVGSSTSVFEYCFNGSTWNRMHYMATSYGSDARIYEDAMWWNVTGVGGNQSLSLNTTIPILDGSYNWGCQSCDINGNCNSSSNQTFTVDTTFPQIIPNSPIGGFYNRPPYLNGTCTDSHLNFIWTNLTEYSGLDSTSPYNFTNTSALINQLYPVNVSCNDTGGNLNSTIFNFTYDNINPSANYSSPTPTNGSTWTNGSVIINVTATDTNPWMAWITSTFGNHNVTSTNISWTNNINISFDFEGLSIGNYTYNITICDLAGNCNTTITRQVNVVLSNINAYIYYPSENQILTYDSGSPPWVVNFTYAINPSSGKTLTNCAFNVTRGGSTEIPTTNLSCLGTWQNFTVSSLSTTYIINLWANQSDNGQITYSRTFVANPTVPTPPGGGGSITPPGNVTWTMKTEQGTGNYHFSMGYGSSRVRSIVFYNIGTATRTIKLSCSGDLCHYINFTKTNVDLPVGLEIATYSDFTVKIPDTETAKNMTANIIGLDDVGLQNILTIQVDLGQGNVLLDILNKFPNSREIGNFMIPYWVIFFVAWVFVFFLLWLILRKFSLGIFISVLIGLIASLILMIFI
jgi:hypothetical protein